MTGFGEDLSALRTFMKHVDDRTLRGEKLMNAIQMDQRHTSRVVDAIAEKLQVTMPPTVPKVVEIAPEPEMEDDDFDEAEDDE